MPKQYEDIKKSYLKRGKSMKEAKRLAAMTYNARHPGHPMKPHRKKRTVPRPGPGGYY